MPIKIGKKTYSKFKDAEKAVKKKKPGIKSPGGYVAAIERREGKLPKKKGKR